MQTVAGDLVHRVKPEEFLQPAYVKPRQATYIPCAKAKRGRRKRGYVWRCFSLMKLRIECIVRNDSLLTTRAW